MTKIEFCHGAQAAQRTWSLCIPNQCGDDDLCTLVYCGLYCTGGVLHLVTAREFFHHMRDRRFGSREWTKQFFEHQKRGSIGCVVLGKEKNIHSEFLAHEILQSGGMVMVPFPSPKLSGRALSST